MRRFLRLFQSFRELEERLQLLDQQNGFLKDTIRGLGVDKAALQDRVIELERRVAALYEEVKAAKDREVETLRTVLHPPRPSIDSPAQPIFGRRQISRVVAEHNAETKKVLAQVLANNGEIQT